VAQALEGWVPHPRPTLLLTEDETLMRETLARYFEGRGFQVTGAASLAESREVLDRDRFDVVVLDVGLPDGDGLSLLDRVPPERAVVITANPDPERMRRWAVRHHLAKPLDLEVLARAVEALLEDESLLDTET
jgi:DNA-binding response OmpR family regulator